MDRDDNTSAPPSATDDDIELNERSTTLKPLRKGQIGAAAPQQTVAIKITSTAAVATAAARAEPVTYPPAHLFSRANSFAELPGQAVFETASPATAATSPAPAKSTFTAATATPLRLSDSAATGSATGTPMGTFRPGATINQSSPHLTPAGGARPSLAPTVVSTGSSPISNTQSFFQSSPTTNRGAAGTPTGNDGKHDRAANSHGAGRRLSAATDGKADIPPRAIAQPSATDKTIPTIKTETCWEQFKRKLCCCC